MSDQAAVELDRLITLKRRATDAIEWHAGMGPHVWCTACDLVDILRGGTP